VIGLAVKSYLTYQATCRLDATPKTTVSKTDLNIPVPLFLYTRRSTQRSRDKSRAAHIAIATLVVNYNWRNFRIGIWIQYLYAFSLSILFSIWSYFL